MTAQPRAKRRRFNVRQSLAYRTATGYCPVCNRRKAVRVTCGDKACVSVWTIGYVPAYYQNGVEKE